MSRVWKGQESPRYLCNSFMQPYSLRGRVQHTPSRHLQLVGYCESPQGRQRHSSTGTEALAALRMQMHARSPSMRTALPDRAWDVLSAQVRKWTRNVHEIDFYQRVVRSPLVSQSLCFAQLQPSPFLDDFRRFLLNSHRCLPPAWFRRMRNGTFRANTSVLSLIPVEHVEDRSMLPSASLALTLSLSSCVCSFPSQALLRPWSLHCFRVCYSPSIVGPEFPNRG
ncbi:hypothetical protein BJ546DRAFT_31620 [Cryomyces antarcticus]